MSIVIVPVLHIETTLRELKHSGSANHEGIVLWLGQRRDNDVEVQEAFVPLHYAEDDYFRIPREGMAALLAHLRQTKRIIAAQVHSHPELAFHSFADDTWAVVRHVGALSLVVPHFAQRTTTETFARDVAVFELSPENKWIEVPSYEVNNRYIITQ